MAAATPELAVTRRDVGRHPVDATAWAASSAAGATPPESWTPEQRAGSEVASGLATELEQADAFLFAAPLYNWGVSQHLKTWVDVVVTEPRFLPRTTTIAGRPAVLVIARGGDYRDDSPRSDWDHATSWMRRIFVDVWGLDLRIVSVDLTLAPARDHLAHLRGDAAAELERAEADADEAGAALAGRLVPIR
jgi:FMN-dependent NADH-azoreductase